LRVARVGLSAPNFTPGSSALGVTSRRELPVDRPYPSPIRISNLSGASDWSVFAGSITGLRGDTDFHFEPRFLHRKSRSQRISHITTEDLEDTEKKQLDQLRRPDEGADSTILTSLLSPEMLSTMLDFHRKDWKSSS
jgi:hypothetical protein